MGVWGLMHVTDTKTTADPYTWHTPRLMCCAGGGAAHTDSTTPPGKGEKMRRRAGDEASQEVSKLAAAHSPPAQVVHASLVILDVALSPVGCGSRVMNFTKRTPPPAYRSIVDQLHTDTAASKCWAYSETLPENLQTFGQHTA